MALRRLPDRAVSFCFVVPLPRLNKCLYGRVEVAPVIGGEHLQPWQGEVKGPFMDCARVLGRRHEVVRLVVGVVHPADFKFELLFYESGDVIAYQSRLACLAVLGLCFQLTDLGVVFAKFLGHRLDAAGLLYQREQVGVSDLRRCFHGTHLKADG